MTIQGALAELVILRDANDVPSYYKGSIKKVIETIVMKSADRKTENCSEKPNNCEPTICDNCRYYNSNIPCGSTPSACKEADKFAEEFVNGLKKLKPKDEPQTDTEIARAIVHKMIDDAVLAEDAYPDLRQKMHDAVDEYEPQTDKGVSYSDHTDYDGPKTYVTWTEQNADMPTENTTCVGVAMALLDDEPQTDYSANCYKCKKIKECKYPPFGRCEFEPKDEPQTERTTTEQLTEQLTEQPQTKGSE